ncbi:hypothetical protein M2310_001956 [Rhizobium leguminosarum]|uniref:Uncharacterized protein n=1 Tax=Rhizobium esperanzae TaxID=1967781 RepID=A0A7W6XV32_9HYPH|nr:hypothetical protein [Rhizobium esperanzae]MDH6201285.1 hypothetical protein [Rhizobium leguminosarum]
MSVERPLEPLLSDRKAVPPTSLDNSVSWTASEFLLIESLIGETEHRIIDRWPLLG